MLTKAGRKVRAGLRHLRVLAASLLNPGKLKRLTLLAGLLPKVTTAYDHGGLPALSAAIEPPPHAQWTPDALENALAQIDALVAFTVASRFRTCLRRSALRYYVLRAAGQPAVLVIGARRIQNPAGLDGHAWVEVDGQPFRDDLPLIASMTPMYRHPGEIARSA